MAILDILSYFTHCLRLGVISLVFSSDDWRVKCDCHIAYDKNITIIKKFNDDYYKLVTFNALRVDGVELDSDHNKAEKGSVNDVKLLNNISRARNNIFELAMCNDWDYFVTLTLSPDKLSALGLDRYDLKTFYKYFSKWINNLSRDGFKIQYLLVPEKHNDGAWHFHGFMSGLNPSQLSLFTPDDCLPVYILRKLNNGDLIYNWLPYYNKFGFCDFEYIKDQTKCSSYVTKYISKELYRSINNLGYHCYYCSQGLKRAERIFKKKVILDNDFEYDFSNDYVSVKVLSDVDLQSLGFM